jgi:hypothetical protein
MARKTQGEMLAEVAKTVETHDIHLNSLQTVVKALEADQRAFAKRVEGLDGSLRLLERLAGDLKDLVRMVGESGKDIAVLKDRVEELKKGRDEWGRRLWLIVVAVAGGVIGYFLKR